MNRVAESIEKVLTSKLGIYKELLDTPLENPNMDEIVYRVGLEARIEELKATIEMCKHLKNL